jgi:hypothetical protein
MFPSAHDITPAHLDDCMIYLEHMLKPGNQVTIVTVKASGSLSEILLYLLRFYSHSSPSILFI